MSDMEYTQLGESGLMVSAVSLGTWAIGGRGWGEVNDRDSIAAIRKALDVGMTFIDTAHTYGLGHAEEIIGQAIEGRRQEAIIATKVSGHWNEKGERWVDCSYDGIMRAVQAGLKRLRTDYIDVYLIHSFDPNTPIPETEEEEEEEEATPAPAITDVMVEIPAGPFTLGNDNSDPNEAPAQEMELQPFRSTPSR